MSADEWAELDAAVRFLDGEQALNGLVHKRESPQRAVERTLAARQTVQRHQARLTAMLDHTHGSIEEKFNALKAGMEAEFADTPAVTAEQLLAPHRHLRDALHETRRDVAGVAATASDTASLIATAAVGRLLDRTEASRMTASAVATLLALLSLITTFTAIASIPSDNRNEEFLTRLGAGTGFAGVLVLAGVYAIARLSARSVRPRSKQVRRSILAAAGLAVVVAVGLLLSAVFTASLATIIAAAGLVLAAVVAFAALNDF